MRVLVTGATGFTGSWIVRCLLAQGDQVATVRRPGSDVHLIQDVLSQTCEIVTELTDPEAWLPAVQAFAPDTFVHTAWSGVTSEKRNDVAQVTDNLQREAAVLQVAAQAGCSTYIAFGSQAEYAVVNHRMDETVETSPATLYGVAKLAAYHLTRIATTRSRMRLVWLRLFSAYGPGDKPDRMLPTLIRQLLAQQSPALTACEQRWDYVYVKDVADAVVALAHSPAAEGIFNLGSGRIDLLRTVVERVRDLIDKSLPLSIGALPYRPDQTMHLEADPSRLMHATGWSPRTTLEQGLAETVAWISARQRATGQLV